MLSRRTTTAGVSASDGRVSDGTSPDVRVSDARPWDGRPALDRALCVRLTGFVSRLRENGFSVGVDDATLLVEAASRIGVLDPLVLRWSAQALLCRRAADLERFADLFDSRCLRPHRRQLVENRSGGVGELEPGDR